MCYGRNPEMSVVEGHFTWHVASSGRPWHHVGFGSRIIFLGSKNSCETIIPFISLFMSLLLVHVSRDPLCTYPSTLCVYHAPICMVVSSLITISHCRPRLSYTNVSGMLEYALSLARDLAHSWPSWPPSILSVCNSSIKAAHGFNNVVSEPVPISRNEFLSDREYALAFCRH
jgi:hypothetical protein